MASSPVVVQGTLKADGTIVPDQKPNLPPGRVELVIRAVSPAAGPQEDWWQYLQRARAELEAMGHRFRTKEEIDAEIEDLCSGEERLEEVYRQIEAARSEGGSC
jgi:hypothetical protein